jgi:CRISPR system Cascade subunit CasE
MTYFIQINVDIVKAARHLQSFFSHTQMADDSLVLKTMLTEAFSGAVVRPWAIHSIRGSQVMIVGYSDISADEANERRALALPSVQASVGEAVSAELPKLQNGQSYRFSVQLVPTIRVTKKEGGPRYGERDAFLAEVDRSDDGSGLTRDVAYQKYLTQRLPGAEIGDCRLSGFRLRAFVRSGKGGKPASKTMPEAVLEGTLKVTDNAALVEVVTSGIGRQRAFGFGMLRLQPQRPSNET